MKSKTSQFIQMACTVSPTIGNVVVTTAWVWTKIVQTLQQGGQTRRDT